MARLYDDAPCAVRDDLEHAHRVVLADCAHTGTWWTGTERAALVSAARAARAAAGLQDEPSPVAVADTLPAPAQRVAREVASAPFAIERALFDDAVIAGLSPEAYVETVGITARISGLDTFARGLGIPPRHLPPVVDSEPSRVRPATATDEGAWVPTIPNGAAGGADGARLFGKDFAANILRALSLVPDEARAIIALNTVQYCSVATIMDLGYTHDPAVTRDQVELVAARISALNACFY